MSERLFEPLRRRRGRVAAAPIALVALVALAVAACGGAAGSAPPTSSATSPAPSAATPPTAGSPITEAEAVARVLASDPRFAGIGPPNPDLIGQSAWYEVSPATVGWRVAVTIGWGDCQAGCISRRTWVYEVDTGGNVRLVEERGDPLDDGSGLGEGAGGGEPLPPVAIPADGGPWIAGRALAGPVCPVVQDPPDPACADRPVAGAIVLVRDAGGREVARATTAADGTFLAAVPAAGGYVVEAGPVEGLLGTPAPQAVVVPAGPAAWASVDLAYDTGIR
jgi:hypothetical protein